jgi:hypothetical protein
LLRQRRAGERQRRADAERNQGIMSHRPVSTWIIAGVMMLSKIGRL